MLWGMSEMVNARAFKPLPFCSEPWKLTRRHYWSSRNERKPLFQQKCVLRKCCGVCQKWWMVELSNLCHCVQHPWKPSGRNFWSSRNKRKPLCQQKCVLRKFCGVCQKWWMLELSNLCHCVQHPWKLTCRHYWSSRKKRKPLFQLKHVLRKCSGVSQKWWMLELSNLCQCVQHPWNLLIGITGALRTQGSHLVSKNVFWEKSVGYVRMVNARAFKPLPLCSAPLKTYWYGFLEL